MRKTVSSALALAIALSATSAPAASKENKTLARYEVPKGERTVYVAGSIDGSSLSVARKIERLSAASDKDINIFINSPGGVVIVGLQIIQAMDIARTRGVKIKCSVGVLAASMAFQLLPHCDERYAMRHSMLLFHPARAIVNGGITGEQAVLLGKELSEIDRRANIESELMMGSPAPGWLVLHHRNETFWQAQDLVDETMNNWLTIVDVLDVPGGPFNLNGDDEVRDQARPSVRHSIQLEFNGKPWIIVNI